MAHHDRDQPRDEPADDGGELADDGMAPLVTNTGADDDGPGDDADAPTG